MGNHKHPQLSIRDSRMSTEQHQVLIDTKGVCHLAVSGDAGGSTGHPSAMRLTKSDSSCWVSLDNNSKSISMGRSQLFSAGGTPGSASHAPRALLCRSHITKHLSRIVGSQRAAMCWWEGRRLGRRRGGLSECECMSDVGTCMHVLSGFGVCYMDGA